MAIGKYTKSKQLKGYYITRRDKDTLGYYKKTNMGNKPSQFVEGSMDACKF